MKLKHWQGYGTVNAVKIEDTPSSVVIEVTGAHEYGLVREDMYDVKHWLLDRLARKYSAIPYTYLDLFVYEESWKKAIYTIRPRNGMSWKQALALSK